MNKKLILIAAIAIVAILGATLISNRTSVEQVTDAEMTQPMELAAVLSLTGFAASDGEHIANSIQLAIRDLEAEGMPINLTLEDDGTDSKQTVGLFRRLGGNTDAILGPTWGFQVSSVMEIINEDDIVTLSPAVTSEVVEGSSDNIFYGAIKNAHKRAPTADWLASADSRRVAILVTNDAWGVNHTDVWTKAAEDAGAEVVAVEKIDYGSTIDSLRTVITKLKSKNVDSFLVSLDEAGTISVVKQAQVLDYKPNILSTKLLRTVIEGELVTKGDLNLSVIEILRNSEFDQRYKEAYGTLPGQYGEAAYDLTTIAVRAHFDQSNEDLAIKIKRLDSYKGYQTHYTFDDKGDIEGGEWVVKEL